MAYDLEDNHPVFCQEESFFLVVFDVSENPYLVVFYLEENLLVYNHEDIGVVDQRDDPFP